MDNYLLVQKMVFIYNALITGWSVRMINNKKFEFTKPLSHEKKEVLLEDYLEKFIKYNLNIENMIIK